MSVDADTEDITDDELLADLEREDQKEKVLQYEQQEAAPQYTKEEQAYLDKGKRQHAAWRDSFEKYILPEIQDQIDKFEKTVLFNGALWSDDKKLNEVVEAICNEFDLGNHKRDQVLSVLKIVLLNLLCTRKRYGEEYRVRYSRDKNLIDVPQQYRGNGLSYKYFIFVVESLRGHRISCS